MRRPIGASLVAGLVASLCCGGSLVFASLGLGAFYGALGLSAYVPQVLAIGAVSIVTINYALFRRAAQPLARGGVSELGGMRRRMLRSAAVGLLGMVTSFVVLDWLNHAVVHPTAFLGRPEYGSAFIPGVPNVRLLYALASLVALPLLWALPFPRAAAGMPPLLQRGALVVSSLILVLLLVSGVGPIDPAGPIVPEPHRPVPHGG